MIYAFNDDRTKNDLSDFVIAKDVKFGVFPVTFSNPWIIDPQKAVGSGKWVLEVSDKIIVAPIGIRLKTGDGNLAWAETAFCHPIIYAFEKEKEGKYIYEFVLHNSSENTQTITGLDLMAAYVAVN